METLPQDTNLLASILARLEDAGQTFSGPKRTEPRNRRGFLDERYDLDPFMPLRKLQNDVAIAWNGNLEARGAHLDADSYAVELFRAEKSRLKLNENFNKALNSLAGIFGRDQLFVLPVDDFDLNPSRSLELLRFFREISVPRLFTIVLGDTKVAELIINLRLAREFAELAGLASSSTLLPIPAEEVRAMSGELASHLVRKLIPPAQVLRLRSMTVAEALNCAPSAGGPEGSGKRLYELLRECPVSLDEKTGITNLADFLFVQLAEPDSPSTGSREKGAPKVPESNKLLAIPGPFPTDRPHAAINWFEEAVSDRGVYQARRVMQTTPRRVVDLAFELQSILAMPGTDPKSELLEVLRRRFKNLIAEDSSLSPAIRQQLQNGLTQAKGDTWTVESEDYRIEPQVSSARLALVFEYDTSARSGA